MPEAVVAITGASGAQYGVRLVDELLNAGWSVSLIVTNAGAINLDRSEEHTSELQSQ